MNEINSPNIIEDLSDNEILLRRIESGFYDTPKLEDVFITGSIRGTNLKIGSPVLFPNNDFFRENLGIEKKSNLFLSAGYMERSKLQDKNKILGLMDDRNPGGDSFGSPSGIAHVNIGMDGLDLTIEPNILKEPFKTVTNTPFGPKRMSEADKKRMQCYHMYSIDTSILDFIGYDSNGKPHYTDGNSYIERCIYTGYDKSFIAPKIWNPRRGGKSVVLDEPYKISKNGMPIEGTSAYGGVTFDKSEPREFAINEPRPINDPILMISKSGYYYTTRQPIKSLFLGYNDSNTLPNKSTFFEKPREGKKYFYSDRTSEHELYADLVTPNTVSYRKNVGPKFGGKFRDGKEESHYNSSNTKTSDKFMGSYRSLLLSLSKVDIVDIKTQPFGGGKRPVLRRRSEQYGPNPLQHLFYMDYYDWRKYTSTYIPSDEKILNASWKELYCVETLRSDTYDPNLRVFPVDNFFNSGKIGRFEVYPNDVMVDKTRILDIYFGLMEMHIKSFSWNDIFKIIDLIPNFRSEWTDPNWKNLTWLEKNEIRMKELGNLEPIWEIIEKILSASVE